MGRFFKDGDSVDKETLVKSGLLRSAKYAIKILGNDKLEQKLNVAVSKVTKGAKQAIEAAGGVIKGN